MTRTIEDIYSYQKQALDLLDENDPNYVEMRSLLIQQINDELHDYAHTKPNRGAS